jgi:hypothetical protein
MSEPLTEKVRDYATSERLLRLLVAAEPVGSDDAKRAALLHAKTVKAQAAQPRQ